MTKRRGIPALPRIALLAALTGCSSSPAPRSVEAPPAAAPSASGSTYVVGAGDSVQSIPGSPDAPYLFRFRQIEPPSDRFTFQDRELSFHFRPTPDALHFQIENRQNRPVSIEWQRCVFIDPHGRTDKVAHGTTRWEDRFTAQPSTQIGGLQRYGNYVLPLGYLVDPAGSTEQIHRPLIPEDSTSPQFTDRVFGVDLVVTVEDRPRVYPFRFRIVSVIPR